MKKLLLILLTILLLSTLTGCKEKTLKPEIETIESSTWIHYNTSLDNPKDKERKIIVNNLTIPFNDKFYTFVINDSVNYSNNQAYFSTPTMDIEFISGEHKTGVTKHNDKYNVCEQIDEDVYLLVDGNSLEEIENLYSNLYISKKPNYVMFDHNISEDWLKEFTITADVISFSNGEDTIYIYHNEGSPDGPTIFYKQLNGIDIPITYPENEWQELNYDTWNEDNTPVVIDGYTPYSAYDISYEEGFIQYTTFNSTTRGSQAAYIILAKDGDTLKSLFTEKQTISSINPLTVNFINGFFRKKEDVKSSIIDLTDKMEIAKDIINSDNRFHMQLLGKKDKDYVARYYYYPTDEEFKSIMKIECNNDFYIDGQTGWIKNAGHDYTEGNNYDEYEIQSNMAGRLLIPSIKVNNPEYESGYDSLYSCGKYFNHIDSLKTYKSILDHGGWQTKEELNSRGRFSNHWINFAIIYYIQEGDYIYDYHNGMLEIYKCDYVDVFEDGSRHEWNAAEKDKLEKGSPNDLYLRTCFINQTGIFHGPEKYRSISYPGIIASSKQISRIDLNK